MTALTDAQVAALREAAEKLVALEVSWHVPWRIRAGAMADGVRVEVSEYVHALSPDVILALLAERDALKVRLQNALFDLNVIGAQLGISKREDVEPSVSKLVNDLSALRARETGLREAMHAIYKGLSSEKDGEFWTAQKWCDDHDIYVDNLQGLRVLEEIARVVMSEGVK